MEAPLDLSVQLAPDSGRGLLLSNPVITASGTFGYGIEYAGIIDIQELGAIICKGTTLTPHEGNPQPRIAETASGMINSIGLQNIGVDALIKEKATVWSEWQVPVLVNIAGTSIEEYALLAQKLDGVPGISGLEVNISCPNVKAGGAEFGAEPEPAARVVRAVRAATTLPIIVKLTPNTARIKEIACVVENAGADALCLINTIRAMAIDIERRCPLLGNVTGGLSGAAIKPVALSMVYEVAGVVKIPIVGCGGISTGKDAVEFIMAGASAVEVGTATFSNPSAPLTILEEIKKFMLEHNIRGLKEIKDSARN